MKKIGIKLLLILTCVLIFFSMVSSAHIMFKQSNQIKIQLNNDNNPPNPPEIQGPIKGKINEYQTYYITVTDPDEEDYLYKLEVDFGDGIIEEDCGCGALWSNGEVLEIRHRWKEEGEYQITARVADVYNYWSEWSEPLTVTMPLNIKISILHNTYIIERIKQILNYFPI